MDFKSLLDIELRRRLAYGRIERQRGKIEARRMVRAVVFFRFATPLCGWKLPAASFGLDSPGGRQAHTHERHEDRNLGPARLSPRHQDGYEFMESN